ncbi:hypothetical protein DPPLL_13050 [Desulfofustis limnaeus]|uniref:Uncharacterized protein n=1 Tax=Desulfofustis limnaeus TaxID=2740163 RepID=A0ABN6M4W5_9BACT|nr:hypothetical protein DPPLL_13050 [Desulfofustis limnaeus]
MSDPTSPGIGSFSRCSGGASLAEDGWWFSDKKGSSRCENTDMAGF